jgi:uncharacterized protein YndB with AHSA1/START domain
MSFKTRGYAHRIDIAAVPPKVWTVLCGPTMLPLWLGTDARIKPQHGGRLSATVAPGLAREAIIDVFDPPRRLRLIYLSPPDLDTFDGAVVDDLLLDTEGDHTIVRLLGSGFPDSQNWNAHYLKVRTVSERSLARLKVLVEQRERMMTAAAAKKT